VNALRAEEEIPPVVLADDSPVGCRVSFMSLLGTH
jgi:hypothetical protein